MEWDSLLARLQATPVWLRTMLSDTGQQRGKRSPSPGAWSAGEILAHLRAADAILAPRIVLIVMTDTPALPAVDERALAERAGYLEDAIQVALAAFTARRGELVRLLERLPQADWKRRGIHPERGAIGVAEIAAMVVEHEEEHRLQMEAALQ
ncbi:MAG: DinB family protein [Dehalococcoidia bacterium]